jgi:glycyl-tRNA synthetase beta subunit
VDAVLATQGDNPAQAKVAVMELNEAVKREDWPVKLAAYARCARIVRTQTPDAGRQTPDSEPEAMALRRSVDALARPAGVQSLISNLQSLTPPINAFFDKVMVMAEDPGLRASRLALLQCVVAQADGIADLSKLEGF